MCLFSFIYLFWPTVLGMMGKCIATASLHTLLWFFPFYHLFFLLASLVIYLSGSFLFHLSFLLASIAIYLCCSIYHAVSIFICMCIMSVVEDFSSRCMQVLIFSNHVILSCIYMQMLVARYLKQSESMHVSYNYHIL